VLVHSAGSTAGEGKPRKEAPILSVGNEGHRCEAIPEIGFPEGNGGESPVNRPLEEKLKASRILGLKGDDVLALLVPLLELGVLRNSKSSDSMGRLSYLIARGQVAARDDVERVSRNLGGSHDSLPYLSGESSE